MKLNPAKKRLQESVTRRDLDLWNKYCWATQTNEYADVPEDVIYTIDDIPDIIDRAGGNPVTSFWNGVDSINIRGSKYLTCAGGIFRGLSEREVSDYLSDPDFLEWKKNRDLNEPKKNGKINEALASNHMKELANLLGVELGEVFGMGRSHSDRFRFTEHGLETFSERLNDWKESNYTINRFINGYFGIVKIVNGRKTYPVKHVNVMKEVAQMLGVEMGKPFYLEGFGKTLFRFTEKALERTDDEYISPKFDNYYSWDKAPEYLVDLLTGNSKIVKISKSTLDEE